jgi:TATA-box binding protein (TBP) (component of TFIID and TFIIIB)
MRYKVLNVVVSGVLPVPGTLNLERVVEMFENAEYNPKWRPSVFIRFPKENHVPCVQLYKSGQFQLMGLRSEEEAAEICETMLKRITGEGAL